MEGVGTLASHPGVAAGRVRGLVTRAPVTAWLSRCLARILGLGVLCARLGWAGTPEPAVHAGPLFERFRLTLEPGEGVEAAGPFFYRYEGEDDTTWGMPPLVSVQRSHDGERSQWFVLPPLFTSRRYGEDWRWQFLQLLNSSSLDKIDDPGLRRFNLFPLFFYQDSTDPAKDFWALFPLYGTLQNRMFRDEAEFVLFPAWLKTRKGTVTTRNVLFPLIHFRDGPGLEGWQVWPLVGHERLEPSTRTNVADEVEIVGGHDKWFGLWPVYFRNRLGIGTENPVTVDAVLPLFYTERSPNRDHTSLMWPFFSWTDNKEEKWRQWNAPFPLVAFARGEGKTLDRVIPFFSVGRTETLTFETYGWPLYRRHRLHTREVERDREQFGVFLYVRLDERNLETGQSARRLDSWPLFTWTRSTEGKERLQVLSVLEPLRRGRGIERNWAPLWSLWRQERDTRTGARSESLLWNLYRRERRDGVTKGSILFGLVQYEASSAGRRWRWFHAGGTRGLAASEATHVP